MLITQNLSFTGILCRTLDSTSTRAECTYKSAWISCKSAVPTETKAEISFKNNYGPTIDLDVPQSNNVTCNEHGQWEPEPVYCTPGPFSINIYVNDTKLALNHHLLTEIMLDLLKF